MKIMHDIMGCYGFYVYHDGSCIGFPCKICGIDTRMVLINNFEIFFFAYFCFAFIFWFGITFLFDMRFCEY